MSQIPVLKSAAHTHTRKADKAVSTEPFHSSSRCSKCCEVERRARPGETFHGCRSLNLSYPPTPRGIPGQAASIPSCAEPFCRDFPRSSRLLAHGGVGAPLSQTEGWLPQPEVSPHPGSQRSFPSLRGAGSLRPSFALSFVCLVARGGLCLVLFHD